MAKDYYEILGVDKNASPEEIKRVYQARAKTSHPDRFPKDSPEWRKAHQVFSELNEAYSVLRNPGSRRDYDNQRVYRDYQEPVYERQNPYGQEWAGWGQSYDSSGRGHGGHPFGGGYERRAPRGFRVTVVNPLWLILVPFLFLMLLSFLLRFILPIFMLVFLLGPLIGGSSSLFRGIGRFFRRGASRMFR